MSKILLILVVVAIIVFVAVTMQGKHYEQFAAKALKAEGVLDAKEEKIADPKAKRKEYWLLYTFTDAAGKTYHDKEQLEYSDMWDQFAEGQKLTILYDPSNTAESHIETVLNRRLGISRALDEAIPK